MENSRDEENHGSGDGGRGATVLDLTSPTHGESKDQTSISTPAKQKKATNAFAMMMSGTKKNSGKKRNRSSMTGDSSRNQNTNTTTTSRFVLCPAGCGKHILPHEMNKHLDACLLKQAKKEQEQQEREREQQHRQLLKEQQELLEQFRPPLTPEKQSENLEPKGPSTPITTTPVKEMPPTPIPLFPTQSLAKDEPAQTTSPEEKTAVDNTDEKQNNAFAHMMKMSATAFSEQETSSPKLYERMHLESDGQVTLTCYKSESDRSLALQEPIAWSATIQVRGTKDGEQPPIDLLVTSSIQSSITKSNEPERVRLVRRHSRLSVPILKSILQKGIRRRKPLPSVRVTAELADKSLGDLLRRLPIIILEDSTLHPEFPFLVWLMMAVSKDYQPPLPLLKHVLQIVFEIASCRWQDSLPNHNNSDVQNEPLSLASLHKTAISNLNEPEGNGLQQNQNGAVLNDNDLIVWSMLLRKQYGGMACDIRMLQGYAELWHNRFYSKKGIPNDIKKRLSPNNSVSAELSTRCPSTAIDSEQKTTDTDQCLHYWWQVPVFIHEAANKQSASRIDRLLVAHQESPTFARTQNSSSSHSFVGLTCLTKFDLTIEGVDFHCSNILESAVLSDNQLVRECFVRLINSNIRLPTSMQDRRSWLEGLLKTCMWNYGGGVNFRMPLLTTKTKEDDRDLKEFYETLIRPRADAFSKRYIEERISR